MWLSTILLHYASQLQRFSALGFDSYQHVFNTNTTIYNMYLYIQQNSKSQRVTPFFSFLSPSQFACAIERQKFYLLFVFTLYIDKSHRQKMWKMENSAVARRSLVNYRIRAGLRQIRQCNSIEYGTIIIQTVTAISATNQMCVIDFFAQLIGKY